MKDSEILGLDRLGLYRCILERQMDKCAIETGGGIVAAELCVGGNGYYFALSLKQREPHSVDYIRPYQIEEFNRRKKECGALCDYFSIMQIGEVYGYIMERVAEYTHGKEYAAQWREMWEHAKICNLGIIMQAFTKNDRKLLKFKKDLYFSEKHDLSDYADLPEIEREIQRFTAQLQPICCTNSEIPNNCTQAAEQPQQNAPDYEKIKDTFCSGFLGVGKGNNDETKRFAEKRCNEIIALIYEVAKKANDNDNPDKGAIRAAASMVLALYQNNKIVNMRAQNARTFRSFRRLWGFIPDLKSYDKNKLAPDSVVSYFKEYTTVVYQR